MVDSKGTKYSLSGFPFSFTSCYGSSNLQLSGVWCTSRQLLQFSGFKSAILALTLMPIAQSAALSGQSWLLPRGTAQAKLDLLQKALPIFLSWH